MTKELFDPVFLGRIAKIQSLFAFNKKLPELFYRSSGRDVWCNFLRRDKKASEFIQRLFQ